MTPATAPARNNLKGIVWMLVYAALISGMHVCVRLTSEGVHPFEIAFFRTFFALIALVPWFIRLGWTPLKTNRLGLLVTRGALNTVCMLAYFYALAITPLADVTALSFMAPIYATIIGIFVFKESVGLKRWAAIAVGMAGVFVVLRPGFQEIGTGHLLVVSSAFGWAVCLVIIKELGRTESALTITTYMSLVMAPLALIPAAFVWTWPSGEILALLLLLGILGGLAQLAMTESLRQGETHVVTPFDFSRLIFVTAMGAFILDQIPDAFVWLGGAMIMAATAFIAYREHVLHRQQTPSPAEKSV